MNIQTLKNQSVMTIRSTVRQAQNAGVALVKATFLAFANSCKAAGFTRYYEVLDPKAGKAPCLFFLNPANDQQVIVVLSKAVSEHRKNGKMPNSVLRTLSVIEGKNAKGEDRYYLSSNGITEVSVDEVIAHTQKCIDAANEVSLKRLADILGEA